jgi:hypothetical protein
MIVRFSMNLSTHQLEEGFFKILESLAWRVFENLDKFQSLPGAAVIVGEPKLAI